MLQETEDATVTTQCLLPVCCLIHFMTHVQLLINYRYSLGIIIFTLF